MTIATQTETGTAKPERRRTTARQRAIRGCFAEWRNFSPQLDWECTDREARLRFANEILFRRVPSPESRVPITSWSQLTTGQAKRLLREMKERSGSNPAWRAMKLAEIAVELFGPEWNAVLRERLIQRFRVASPESLGPRQFWAEVEELVSRIARRDGVETEEVRARFFGNRPTGSSGHRSIEASEAV